MPIAYLTEFLVESTPVFAVSTVFYIIADIAEIAAAIVLWVISAKILAKN